MAYNRTLLMREIDSRLESNPNISLHLLTDDLGVNRHIIERTVRDLKKVSFRQYRADKIVQKACSLFTCMGSLSIKQIAGRLNFSSPEAFARFIKNATGLTPSQLRNKTPRLSL
jgi:AraC-like DNA-binding protein